MTSLTPTVPVTLVPRCTAQLRSKLRALRGQTCSYAAVKNGLCKRHSLDPEDHPKPLTAEAEDLRLRETRVYHVLEDLGHLGLPVGLSELIIQHLYDVSRCQFQIPIEEIKKSELFKKRSGPPEMRYCKSRPVLGGYCYTHYQALSIAREGLASKTATKKAALNGQLTLGQTTFELKQEERDASVIKFLRERITEGLTLRVYPASFGIREYNLNQSSLRTPIELEEILIDPVTTRERSYFPRSSQFPIEAPEEVCQKCYGQFSLDKLYWVIRRTARRFRFRNLDTTLLFRSEPLCLKCARAEMFTQIRILSPEITGPELNARSSYER